MKTLYILRGVPGCGKSTLAKTLGEACEADEYFVDLATGEYKFDFKKLGLAHEFCRSKCLDLMKAEAQSIVISNTNTTPKEFAPYVEMANQYGYTVFFLVVENRHGGSNSHGVPEDKIGQMKDRIKGSLSL